MRKPKSTPRVALLIETARGYGRGLLRGIVKYARLHGPWSFYVTPGDFEQFLPKMRQWGGTGIIARVETPQIARAILDSGLPTVALDLSEMQLKPDNPLSRLSEIASDSHGAAEVAAEHLLERGFRHYAFVGVHDRIWSKRRQEGFCGRIGEAGFEVHVYKTPKLKRDREWYREQAVLTDWLKTLPKPIGLMACNDDRGREVIEACRAAEFVVPEEIAVLGVDNDELLCELADPPLSSVAMNVSLGGFEAAALLDLMMRRRYRKPRRLLVEPLRVIQRRSNRHSGHGGPGSGQGTAIHSRPGHRGDQCRRGGRVLGHVPSLTGNPLHARRRPNDSCRDSTYTVAMGKASAVGIGHGHARGGNRSRLQDGMLSESDICQGTGGNTRSISPAETFQLTR